MGIIQSTLNKLNDEQILEGLQEIHGEKSIYNDKTGKTYYASIPDKKMIQWAREHDIFHEEVKFIIDNIFSKNYIIQEIDGTNTKQTLCNKINAAFNVEKMNEEIKDVQKLNAVLQILIKHQDNEMHFTSSEGEKLCLSIKFALSGSLRDAVDNISAEQMKNAANRRNNKRNPSNLIDEVDISSVSASLERHN